ncbi:hypothetical protein QQF64_024011 [Cirrhinus molitorella]|uniref:AIG1-type G domain-containing protein n=1 Tax=Cirrhinus molitorella TaxID=172907 RepID=A0ABR3NK38_9TELE
MTEKQVKAVIEKSLKMSAPGPHVFLMVIRLGRFTDEENTTVKWIQKNFGRDVQRFMMLLFTGADQLNKPLEKFLLENPELKTLVDECEGRYHAFNNMEKKNQDQVIKLLEKIKTIVEKNRQEYYTIEMFKKTQRDIFIRPQIILAVGVVISLACGFCKMRKEYFGVACFIICANKVRKFWAAFRCFTETQNC